MSEPNASCESVRAKIFWFVILTKSSILLVFTLALHFPSLLQCVLWFSVYPFVKIMFTRTYKAMLNDYYTTRRSTSSTSITIGIYKSKFTSNWQTDKLKHPLASIPSCEGTMFPRLLSFNTYNNILVIVKLPKVQLPKVQLFLQKGFTSHILCMGILISLPMPWYLLMFYRNLFWAP
jgi:hypothetical protein